MLNYHNSCWQTRLEEKKDLEPEPQEEQPPAPVIDTTDQHRAHLFDLNCKVCTGKIVPGRVEPVPKAAREPEKVSVLVSSRSGVLSWWKDYDGETKFSLGVRDWRVVEGEKKNKSRTREEGVVLGNKMNRQKWKRKYRVSAMLYYWWLDSGGSMSFCLDWWATKIGEPQIG